MSLVPCKNSIDYVVKNGTQFDYNTYYYNFCDGMNRIQTESKLKADISKSVFEFESTEPSFDNWVNGQINNNFPILKSTQAEDFWLDHEEQLNFFESKKNEARRRGTYERDLGQRLRKRQESSSEAVSAAMENSLSYRVVEGDTLITFNNRSVCSILKSHGKFLYNKYSSLNDSEKALCTSCLNGVLDLSNDLDCGQKQLFSHDQWVFLKSTFKSRALKDLPLLNDFVLEVINKVKELVDSGNTNKAYYYTLSKVENAPSDYQWLIKVLYHILNAYNERTYIFTAKPPAVTEYDYMAKLWCEMFELMFGKDVQLIKWGESVAKTTTDIKKTNNENKSNTIGCKVDGRIVCKIHSDEILDICEIETAKSTNNNRKNLTDRAKLIAESKCIIDNTVLRDNFKPSNPFMKIQHVQLGGIQGHLSNLKLVDIGLYVNTMDFTLSFEEDVSRFANNIKSWVQKLIYFKNSCNLTTITSSSSASPHIQKDINSAFGLIPETTDKNHACKPSWTRGTFLPPTTIDKLVFPKYFLTSPPNKSQHTIEGNAIYKTFKLDDGTVVQKRGDLEKKKNKSKKGTGDNAPEDIKNKKKYKKVKKDKKHKSKKRKGNDTLEDKENKKLKTKNRRKK